MSFRFIRAALSASLLLAGSADRASGLFQHGPELAAGAQPASAAVLAFAVPEAEPDGSPERTWIRAPLPRAAAFDAGLPASAAGDDARLFSHPVRCGHSSNRLDLPPPQRG